MTAHVKLGDIEVHVLRKNVKHIRLRIIEPSFEVHLSVPRAMPIQIAQALAMSKHDWLAERLQTLRTQYESIDIQKQQHANTRLLWGQRYELVTIHSTSPAYIQLRDGKICMYMDTTEKPDKVHQLLDQWYRKQLMDALAPLVTIWQQKMEVTIGHIVLQKMKTRWGTCNNATRRIRLNVELAKKPPAHLEYVLVHEMIHFFYNNHGADFQNAIDTYLGNWRNVQRELQCFPRE